MESAALSLCALNGRKAESEKRLSLAARLIRYPKTPRLALPKTCTTTIPQHLAAECQGLLSSGINVGEFDADLIQRLATVFQVEIVTRHRRSLCEAGAL